MKRLLVIVAGLCAGSSINARQLELPVTVREPSGLERQSASVCGGIPLPWGQFAKDQSFALFDGETEDYYLGPEAPPEDFVPEPGAALLLASGLAGLAGYSSLLRRRRR